MNSVYRELAHVAKSFSRSPVFATVFVLALATGIGALVSVFSVIDSLVLRPLPLPHPEQLVNISGDYRQHSRIPLSYPMFVELERGQKVFTGICGWTSGGEFGVDIDGKTSLSDVRSVTGNYYSVLGATPLLGRLITPVDIEGSTAAPVAVIGYELWRTRFGGDLSVVGRTLRVDGKLFTIIGVTQKWFAGMTIGSLLRSRCRLAHCSLRRSSKATNSYGSLLPAGLPTTIQSNMLRRSFNPFGLAFFRIQCLLRVPAHGDNRSCPWGSRWTPLLQARWRSGIFAPECVARWACFSASSISYC